MKNLYLHSGDLGDVIYALPIIKATGGGNLHLVTRPWTTPFDNFRLNTLTPLLRYQPYIDEVIFGEPTKPVTHDFSTFRNRPSLFGENLLTRQAAWLNVAVNDEPWLISPKSSTKGNGRVLIHRSPRYQNIYFPWKRVAEVYGNRLLQVGHGNEIGALQSIMMYRPEYMAVADYLELANLIDSCDLFIGNQSSPMSIAIGLGKPVIQEVCLWSSDCLYNRANAQYVYDGSALLPSIAGSKVCRVEPFKPIIEVDELATPKGGWRYLFPLTGELITAPALIYLIKAVRVKYKQYGESFSEAEIKEKIFSYIRNLSQENGTANQLYRALFGAAAGLVTRLRK